MGGCCRETAAVCLRLPRSFFKIVLGVGCSSFAWDRCCCRPFAVLTPRLFIENDRVMKVSRVIVGDVPTGGLSDGSKPFKLAIAAPQ